jgi:DNA-binding XRE family transcriptional regulator
MKKTPDPVDKHVGGRVRSRRVLVGMSQEKLGASLGLTFQQIQKYEKGVSVAFFFEGAPVEATGLGFADNEQTDYVADILATSDGVTLAKAFVRITDPKVRRKIVELVTMMADANAKDAEKSAASAA